ncbi:hypothetical protein RJ641_014804 [Dillenia turbinata]|uniref:UDENN domain-containing protein n=1 Tax=Dillenia turbinata TaxID=194707 RepID=A0AAN8UZY0_9MAGN
MSRSPSFSLKLEPNSKIDPESLKQWVVAFCIIRFDLEQGQLVEECYPPGSLTHNEELEIAFNSFPDSVSQHHNRSSIHDCILFFRFRRRKLLKREMCMQKPLLQIMGPLYFDIGKRALEHIAYFVSLWPEPLPGTLMELPIGNAMLKVSLPPAHDLFGTFRGILLQLWTLWELLLIGEPILIIAPTPSQCSEAVAGLVSLVAPLLCSIDFRPYFTIHDPEFACLNSLQEGDMFTPMLLGVTNLFFLKALRTMPHIVSVGIPPPNSSWPTFGPRASAGRIPSKPEGFGLQQLSLKKLSPSNILNAVKLRREGPLCLMTEHKEAVWSSYAATTKPDTSILNRLIDAGMSPRVEESMSVVNNEILRRHFLELTTNFLAPFGPYFRTSTPSEGASPFADPPPLPSFNVDNFLGNLSAGGPGKFLSKRMRSNWLDLYRQFLNGHNFMPWFQRRHIVAEQEQHRLWRKARMNTDIQQFISQMSEVEVVETFNTIERCLLEETQVTLLHKIFLSIYIEMEFLTWNLLNF